MNKIFKNFLVSISLVLLHQVSFAQNFEDNEVVRAFLDEAFDGLDKSEVPTGYLQDYAFELVDFNAFDGTAITDSNYVDCLTLEMMLRSIRSAAVTDKPFGNVINELNGLITDPNVIPIALTLYKYNHLLEILPEDGFIEIGNARNYNTNLSPDINVNLYSERYLFGFAPLAEISTNPTVTFSFNGLFTNVSINTIEFDFGNGQGYQVVSPEMTYTVTYPSSGEYELKMRATLEEGQVLISHSFIIIYTRTPDTKNSEDDTVLLDTTYLGTKVSAKISFAYNTTTSQLKRPIIVAEGFDPLIFANLVSDEFDYEGTSIFDYDSIPADILQDYDFVYVDWINSEDDIMANAALLEKIIKYVNREKHLHGSAEKNIVIGQSLGGVIARIALRKMELANIAHETSTYVSHDSPHLGANVPLGALYMARDLLSIWSSDLDALTSLASLFSEKIHTFRGGIVEFHNLLNSKAIKQILVNYVNEVGEIDNSCHTEFLETLTSIGFPQGDQGSPISNFAICLSGNGHLSYNSDDHILYYDDNILEHLYAGLAYVLLNKGGICANVWKSLGRHCKLRVKADVRPLIGNTNLLSDLSITYHKTLFGIDRTLNVLSKSHYSSFSKPFYDIVPSSIYDLSYISDMLEFEPITGSSSFRIADSISFIPTASALCLGHGDIDVSDYSQSFYSNPPLVSSSQTPFAAIRLSQRPECHVFGSASVASDLRWVLSNKNMTIDGSLTPMNGDVYTVRDCSYPVLWETSDSNVASIDSNGRIIINSSGFINIIAKVQTSGGIHLLRKRVMVGFPTFSLKASQSALSGNVSYWIMASTDCNEFFDFIDSANLTAHWGVKYSAEPTTIWSEKRITNSDGPLTISTISDFIVTFTGHASSTSALVGFYVEGAGGDSPIYSVGIVNPSSAGGGLTPFPGGSIIINSNGDIIDPSTNEILVPDTKSNTHTYHLYIEKDGIEIEFDHIPSTGEITQSLIHDEIFKREIKRMKPWGTETLIIKPLVLRDEANDVVWETPFSILYKDDM